MTTTNTVKIFIHNCSINLLVGVRDHEKEKPQRVIVTVEAEASQIQPYRDAANADLATVIDYSPLRDFIVQKLPKQGHVPLLETIAQQIIGFCFASDSRIRQVRVRLEKPDVCPEAEGIGIELFATRQGVSAP